MVIGAPQSTGLAKNGDVNIAYSVLGEGRPLVLLHGFSLSRHTWSVLGYTAPLVETGHQLIAIDLRGHGDSSKPHDPASYLADKEASDIKAVLDALRVERASILGYSRGGRVALEFAVLHPSRIHKLAVGGAHPFAQDMSLYRNAVARGIEGWIDAIESSAGPLPTSVKTQIARNDINALRAAVAEDRPDVSDQVSGLDCPAFFYAGSQDPICQNLICFAQLASQGEALELSGCNHVSTFLRAELILRHVIRFLA
jgi:pimeloyl-ACP methyl ester carboxylesterase